MNKLRFRKIQFFIVGIVFVAATCNGHIANAQTVSATVTCDNTWALYYGTATSITSYSNQSGQYGFPPNPFTFNVPPGNNYVYIVAWSDAGGAQGLLATFQGQYGALMRTGYAPWEVKPTNLNAQGLGLTGAQSATYLNSLMSTLNPLVAAGGWTSPTAGPMNSSPQFSNYMGAQKLWPPLANLDPLAKWIWYKKAGATPCLSQPGSPLMPGCDHGEPLIFRLPVDVLKPCLNVASDRMPCCIGRDSKGNKIYAFSATVTNPASSPVPLTISGPTGTSILSYGPQSIPPGNSVVSGTFTVAGPPQFPLCLVFEVTLPDIVDSSSEGSSTGRITEGKTPLQKVKCKGSLCFRDLPSC